ncbi:MAG: amino acid--tRNA ligase-related protein [candidate division NC10 bacterium]
MKAEFKVRQLMHGAKKAQGAEKETFKKDLEKALGEEFDAKLAGHELKLKKMQDEISQLKARIEKRKAVKDKIVQPTFITNPPREISPLAKTSRDNPEEAERFELLVAGMEVANAFSELTDPVEQRLRFEQQAGEKAKGDDESHPIALDYVQALEYGLPPTGGEGIGIDRLAMLLSNRRSIREVILFPLLRPRE